MSKVQCNKAEKAQEVLEADEWYDLLPIEKKLISYSLGLGLVLLATFIISFGAFK